ncbi:hypothetical protein Hanom_Chr09g00848821 [Helianthus anomalus]
MLSGFTGMEIGLNHSGTTLITTSHHINRQLIKLRHIHLSNPLIPAQILLGRSCILQPLKPT